MNKILFTDIYKNDPTFSRKNRLIKAKKILAVIREEKRGDLSKMNCLDIGCSVGLISEYLGGYFRKVVGVDIDKTAIAEARVRVKRQNVFFSVSRETEFPLVDDSFDAAIFNQVYEHAERPDELLKEIKRVLRRGGVCYFGARNKFWLFDGHYPLPFLSWFGEKTAEKYFKLLNKGRRYDIKLYSLGELQDLVKSLGFKVYDYSLEVIKNPQKFNALDIVPVFLGVNYLLYILAKIFYKFIPNYIWILEKPVSKDF